MAVKGSISSGMTYVHSTHILFAGIQSNNEARAFIFMHKRTRSITNTTDAHMPRTKVYW